MVTNQVCGEWSDKDVKYDPNSLSHNVMITYMLCFNNMGAILSHLMRMNQIMKMDESIDVDEVIEFLSARQGCCEWRRSWINILHMTYIYIYIYMR